ncbi:histidine phosphatase family protein [Intrasporangium sp. YIM S08009]|uniref:histidine phosphatase family protein n=1 Tax=Intrasporangium zincisolvens TaxID=3080018 RepID=UPI002B0552E7|nr:histidine phosphatase family protein [Intrasporangium sp. YIM S08009]
MGVHLVYETHATTEDNEHGVATGWLPGRLSAAGRHQAEDLGRRRGGTGVAAVYASDLARAVETARIAFGDSDIPVHVDARLRECDYGRLNGAPVTDVAVLRRRCIDEPFPGGQSYRDVVTLTRSFLADLVRDHDGQSIVVVSHSANRWALQHLLDGTPLEDLVDAPFDWRPGWDYTVPAAPHA